ncbi:MAG: hypothetical protein WCP19_06160, partial [Chloroflexota bacterium]
MDRGQIYQDQISAFPNFQCPGDVANVILGLEEGLSLLIVVDPQGIRWRESFQAGIELVLAGLKVN